MRSVVRIYPGPPSAGGLPAAARRGGVAQSGEHLLCKQGVVGSNPITSTSGRLDYQGGRETTFVCLCGSLNREEAYCSNAPAHAGVLELLTKFWRLCGLDGPACPPLWRALRPGYVPPPTGGAVARVMRAFDTARRGSSKQGHLVDALASRGDEGRSTLR